MLNNHNQWILATVLSDGTKLPVNVEGRAIDAHDPQHHMSHDTCMAAAKLTGYLPAFVLTDKDPFFCLDIDHCLMPDNETWSPLAVEMATKTFAGARVEVSYSGRGLHIWGTYSDIPPHKTKNIKQGIELYHTKRYIIIGQHPSGDESLDMTVPLRNTVEEHFPNANGTQADDHFEWTSEPVPEWGGPEDDDELIEIARSKRGLGSVYRDDKVSFEDLWSHNEDALARAFPDHSGQRGYDASSADMSLAQRLAFYTGKNCERIRRIMEQSPLARDKWEERPDYLQRTILNACRMQTVVYTGRQSSLKTDGTDRRMTRGWTDTADIPKVLAGCVYVIEAHAVLTPGNHRLLTPQQFNAHFGGYTFALDDNRTTRHAFEALTQTPSWEPPKAESTCFRPELPFAELVNENGITLVNTYRDIDIPSSPGDISRWHKFMDAVFTKEDRKILEDWIATAVQNPGRKIGWGPLLQGPEGNGKTFIIEAVTRAIGAPYCHSLNAGDIDGNASKFTGWLERRLLVSVEEIRVAHKHWVMQKMLAWITNKNVEIQSKGKDQTTGDNRANFIFTSNYFDALNLRNDQRRFCPLASKPQTKAEMEKAGLTKPFFKDLWDWAEGNENNDTPYANCTPGFHHVVHYFKNYDVKEQIIGQHAPRSTYYHSFYAAGAGRAEQEVMEAIEQDLPGFRGDWVSTSALDTFLQRKRLAHKIPHSKRNEILTQLDYVPHPALKDGRATRTVMPDGNRPRLYVKKGVSSMYIEDPGKACDSYTRAQTMAADGEDGKVGVLNAVK